MLFGGVSLHIRENDSSTGMWSEGTKYISYKGNQDIERIACMSENWKQNMREKKWQIREQLTVENVKKLAPSLLLLATVLAVGGSLIGQVSEYRAASGNAVIQGGSTITQGNSVVLQSENWGLGFGAEGTQPSGNVSAEALKEYDSYYVGNADEKVIYLTFDCGYENGNTEPILDALKKHNAPATFFVVGHYLESAPELVKRMVEDGHTVGNHTYHHLDMSKISDRTSFQKEMDDVKNLFQEVTGEKLSMYYRPPQGKYSTTNLQMAKEMGYSTFFWSLAYVDWNVDSQPSHEEALDKLTKRIHPGAIVLLHSTSKTNGEIMDELLCKWEKMGYTFGKLEDLTRK